VTLAQDLCGKAEGDDLFDPRLKVGDARTDADESRDMVRGFCQ
jgi:hypothetical protein